MKKLIKKYGADVMEAVAYYEDTLPNMPKYWKIEKIAASTGKGEEVAAAALKDYQETIYC